MKKSHTLKMVLGCLIVFGVLGLLLWQGQANGSWLLLLLLACPLMHVFMMRGHGQHGAAKEKGDSHHHKS